MDTAGERSRDPGPVDFDALFICNLECNLQIMSAFCKSEIVRGSAVTGNRFTTNVSSESSRNLSYQYYGCFSTVQREDSIPRSVHIPLLTCQLYFNVPVGDDLPAALSHFCFCYFAPKKPVVPFLPERCQQQQEVFIPLEQASKDAL